MLLLLSCLQPINHIFTPQPILYWFNALNIMELSTIIVALTVREYNGINIDRGALALFLGYGAMFLQFKRYSWSGLYVTMFQEVITSMIKVETHFHTNTQPVIVVVVYRRSSSSCPSYWRM